METMFSTYDASASLKLSQGQGAQELRKAALYLARNAERAERFPDMCRIMTELVHLAKGEDLTTEERGALIIAFSRVIGPLRASWKLLEAERKIQKENDDEEKTTFKNLLDDYSRQLEKEVKQICTESLTLFHDELSNKRTDLVALVTYLRVCGDYNKYLAEICKDAAAGDKSVKFYREALQVAEGEANLNSTHPCLLDVVLNYSVCLKEIHGDTKQACILAKSAFDQAISKLDDLDEASYKDTTLILQLIRDNLTLWTSSSSSSSSGSKKSSSSSSHK